MKKNKNKKGFTLIELIVVIAILAVLGLLLVPQISGYIDASKDSVGIANAKACYSSIVAKKAALQAELKDINVTIDGKCAPSEVTIDTSTATVTWTDDGKTWTYSESTGEVASPTN